METMEYNGCGNKQQVDVIDLVNSLEGRPHGKILNMFGTLGSFHKEQPTLIYCGGSYQGYLVAIPFWGLNWEPYTYYTLAVPEFMPCYVVLSSWQIWLVLTPDRWRIPVP